MKTLTFIFLLFFTFSNVFAQFVDDFSDGEFTNAPLWSGTENNFIINSNFQLQTNANSAGQAYLSLNHGLSASNNKEWRFKIKQSFSPSGNNYSRVYISASNSDLSTNPNGLYFLFGESGSGDVIRLFNQTAETTTEILTGTTSISSSFNLNIKLTHTSNGLWSLFIAENGTDNYVLETAATNTDFTLSSYFGVQCNYTASNATKFYFDDFYCGDIILDNQAPSLETVTVISNTEIALTFNEDLAIENAENTSNYFINNGIENPITAILDLENPNTVNLLINPLTNGQLYQISAENISDLNNNFCLYTTFSFQYLINETADKDDLLINEFMCDPLPSAGLPEQEFVEIFNRSNKYIDLSDWTLNDEAGTGTINSAWIFPGEYKILIPESALEDYPEGIVVSNFPSLNNTDETIILKSETEEIINQITYTKNWYQDANKENGGFSLERINPFLNCSGPFNWKASNSLIGGTPGVENSIFDASPDLETPNLLTITPLPLNKVALVFNEGIDPNVLMNISISSAPVLNLQQISLQGEFLDKMLLEFTEDIIPGTHYNLTLKDLSDCNGNTADYTFKFLLPETPSGDELIINEILFNPITGGSDYLEIFNRSEKYIDLKNWEIANYNNDTISNFKTIIEHYILAPLDFVVVTKDSIAQIKQYPYAGIGKFIEMDIPALNNDSGTVYLIYNDVVIEKLSYTKDWHFELLDNDKGKALERLSSTNTVNDKNNWHSASKSVNYGTPGSKNSQHYLAQATALLELSSESFSPDADGFEDVVLISYQSKQPNNLGTIKIFNDRGVLVKTLIENQLLGNTGTIKWDGLNYKGQKVSVGPYIIIFETLDISTGEKSIQKLVVTVSGKT